MRRGLAAALAAALLLLAACSDDGDGDDGATGDDTTDQGTTGEDTGSSEGADAPLPAGWEGFASEQYADDAHWMCKPGLAEEADVCARDLDATVVNADGTTEVEPHEPAEGPPVDCFYVYPTTSFDESPNSDLVPQEAEEIATVVNQAARLNATCRVFAPVYRQLTLGGIGQMEGGDREMAYGDVLDAFKHYVVNESDGRGFVLVGHSQGSGHLTALIAEEVDDEPALRDRLVGAYLLGSSVGVPDGERVGGAFENVPLCAAEGEAGCVVTYASFRSTAPPPPNSFFGRASGEGQVAGCVNPGDPAGGRAPLRPYFAIDQPEGTLLGGTAGAVPFADPARAAEVTTPFVTYPDLVEAECVVEGDFSYLELTVNGDPADPRTDDIGGDLSPEWGMHLVDANVAMGDIVELVRAQAEAYAAGT